MIRLHFGMRLAPEEQYDADARLLIGSPELVSYRKKLWPLLLKQKRPFFRTAFF